MGWLKQKALAAFSESQGEELCAQIQRLKGMSNEEIGFLVAGGTKPGQVQAIRLQYRGPARGDKIGLD